MGTSWQTRIERALASLARRTGVTRFCPAERAVRLVEFGTIGLTGAMLNFVVFLALVRRVPYIEAGTVAFFSAICWTFALNWAVTFERPDGTLVRRFAKYLGVCLVGYGIYTATLAATVQVLSLPYWLSSLGAITGGGIWNYLGSEQYALR